MALLNNLPTWSTDITSSCDSGTGNARPPSTGAIADKLLAQADDTDDEDDANASLMVAAPDLLAALERMLAHGERGNLYTARGEDAEVVNQARAAIAKAKGHSG